MSRHEFTITLRIDGDPEDALYVVNRVLDEGILQDAIATNDYDVRGELRVDSAYVDRRGSRSATEVVARGRRRLRP